MKKILLVLLCLSSISLFASDNYAYKFRLTLKDKGKTHYSIDKPRVFLSERAIERRERQNIKIDESDLPIASEYLSKIENTGAIVVAQSKWMQTVSVHCEDSTLVDTLKSLPFVEKAEVVWKGVSNPDALSNSEYLIRDGELFENSERDLPRTEELFQTDPEKKTWKNTYEKGFGLAWENIKMHNYEALTKAPLGKERQMMIAIIDAGFSNLHRIKPLKDAKIIEYKNFVYQGGSIFENASEHGLNVLSCMATNSYRAFRGSAPEYSKYLLLVSEDTNGEFPIEEDYWVAAAEHADRWGVDLINSSLGYNNYQKPTKKLTHDDLDGKATLISRAATMATKKGIFVVCSAGNSGDSEWGKLTPPGDAPGVLTVGAIKSDSIIAKFSSRGLTSDLRIKPDVVALGQKSRVISDNGEISTKNGTSFSAPIMCGIVASLWEVFPDLTNSELLQIILDSSHKRQMPDETYGYGIPDMEKAVQLVSELMKTKEKSKK